jgi:hypothetical protein
MDTAAPFYTTIDIFTTAASPVLLSQNATKFIPINVFQNKKFTTNLSVLMALLRKFPTRWIPYRLKTFFIGSSRPIKNGVGGVYVFQYPIMVLIT